MAAKPATTPEWANTGTKTEATAGIKAEGAAPGAKLAAQHANWLFYWLCLWVAYLRDGIFTGGITADVLTTEQLDVHHADRKRPVAPIGVMLNASFQSGGWVQATAAPATCDIAIEPIVGKKITRIGCNVYGTGAGTITLRLFRSSGLSQTEVASVTVASPAASWATLTSAVVNHDVDNESAYYFHIEMSASGHRVAAPHYIESY